MLGAAGMYTKLATCNLDQWALDFDGNLRRIVESIRFVRMKFEASLIH